MIGLDESSLFERFIAGLFVVIWGGFTWIANRMNDNIKSIDAKAQKNAEELAAFRLHVSEHYPKELTMARLYETIEKISGDVTDLKIMVAKKSH